MEEWKEFRLEQTTDFVAGFAFKSKHFGNYENKVVKIKDIQPPIVSLEGADGVDLTEYDKKKLEKYIVRKNDFVLAMTGATIGKIGRYLHAQESYINQRVLKFIPKEEFDFDFIYYSLLSSEFQGYINNHIDSDSAQPNISANTIGKYIFRVPNKDTQQKIAKILSSLDDKIETNRRINEHLEELAQALFKSWFVDFEPFKDGNFVESELGMIPEGWKVYGLTELVNIIGGYSYKGNELKESDIAMATIKNFDRNGGFKINGYKDIVPSPKLKEAQIVTLFDVIVAHTDLTQNADIIGNPAMIMSLGGYRQLIISMDLVKVESKIDTLSNGFLYSLLKDGRFKKHALGYVNGTTVLHLSKKSLPDYKIALPANLDDLIVISNSLDNLFKQEANNFSEIENLVTLRDTLLPKLMSGEIDVNEVEI